jgi:hypothetical protein
MALALEIKRRWRGLVKPAVSIARPVNFLDENLVSSIMPRAVLASSEPPRAPSFPPNPTQLLRRPVDD